MDLQAVTVIEGFCSCQELGHDKFHSCNSPWFCTLYPEQAAVPLMGHGVVE
jgi:hypothetical protein